MPDMGRPVIVIHGGAGMMTSESLSSEQNLAFRAGMEEALRAGKKILATGGTAMDAVSKAVQILEDCPLFNAGTGAVFTHDGTHELDACIMDGSTRQAGAVASVKHIKNPIIAARLVLEKCEHVLLVGDGAEKFCFKEGGIEKVGNETFSTDHRLGQLKAMLNGTGKDDCHKLLSNASSSITSTNVESAPSTAPCAGPPCTGSLCTGNEILCNSPTGTVGAVALDMHGNLAAATSTGGMTNKMCGRIGDSPLVGHGCYADNNTAAISCTGSGEAIMCSVASHDVACLMAYKQMSVDEASKEVVHKKLPELEGRGGLIAVDKEGNISMPFNCESMCRGYSYIDSDVISCNIFSDDKLPHKI